MANPTLLNFVADAATPTGVYTLTATSGSAVRSSAIDITSADSTGTLFTFP